MSLWLLALAPVVAGWQSPWGGGLAAAVHIPPCRVGHEWEESFVTTNPEMEAMRAQLSNNLSRQHLGRLLETLRADAVIDLRSIEDIRKDAQAAQQAQ